MGKVTRVNDNNKEQLKMVIAETDLNILAPLHTLMVSQLKNQVLVYAVTDALHLEECFSRIKSADILLISQQLADTDLHEWDIREIYILTESAVGNDAEQDNVRSIYKYSSPDSILREVVSISRTDIQLAGSEEASCRMLAVYSPEGGAGKTRISQGLAWCLHEMRSRVLYIDAQWLQTGHCYIDDPMGTELSLPGADPEDETADLYGAVRSQIREKGFSYLPPFKAALISLNIEFGIYEKLAYAAARSGEYDHVILDTDSSFDIYKSSLLTAADTVVVVVRQGKDHAAALEALVKNIRPSVLRKFVLVCNDLTGDKEAGSFPESTEFVMVPEYVEHIEGIDHMDISEYAQSKGIRRLARLVS